MSKTIRFISALGAVFFALVGLSACGGAAASRATPSRRSTTRRSPTPRSSTGCASPRSPRRAPGAKKSVVPEPPNYTACIAHLKDDRAANRRKGQNAAHRSAAQETVRTQYKTLQQEVLGFLISSQWVIGEAKSLGVKRQRRRSQEAVRKNQEPSSSRRRPNSRNSCDLRARRSPICCCA